VEAYSRGVRLPEFIESEYGMSVTARLEINFLADMGGNIMVDAKGRCFSAGKKHAIFDTLIKCSRIYTLPCRSFVCHADEYITFLRGDVVVTNRAEFVPFLKKAGYSKMLQVPENKDISYANVLIVGDHIFMMYLSAFTDEMKQAKGRGLYRDTDKKPIQLR
jgi:hypothetical protein